MNNYCTFQIVDILDRFAIANDDSLMDLGLFLHLSSNLRVAAVFVETLLYYGVHKVTLYIHCHTKNPFPLQRNQLMKHSPSYTDK